MKKNTEPLQFKNSAKLLRKQSREPYDVAAQVLLQDYYPTIFRYESGEYTVFMPFREVDSYIPVIGTGKTFPEAYQNAEKGLKEFVEKEKKRPYIDLSYLDAENGVEFVVMLKYA